MGWRHFFKKNENMAATPKPQSDEHSEQLDVEMEEEGRGWDYVEAYDNVLAQRNDRPTFKPWVMFEIYKKCIPERYLNTQPQTMVDPLGQTWELVHPYTVHEFHVGDFRGEREEINLRG